MQFIDGTGREEVQMNDPKVRKFMSAMGLLGDQYVLDVQHQNMEKMQDFLNIHKLRLSEEAQRELIGWVNSMHFAGIMAGKGIL